MELTENNEVRTTEEIVRRIREITPKKNERWDTIDDFFGAMRSELVAFLPEDALCQCGLKGISGHRQLALTRKHVLKDMRAYMPFALQKALDHRGLSAARSIDRYRAWLWLLGDCEYGTVPWQRYQNYGMPILKHICERYGFDFPSSEDATRMAEGRPCVSCLEHYTEGCDS